MFYYCYYYYQPIDRLTWWVFTMLFSHNNSFTMRSLQTLLEGNCLFRKIFYCLTSSTLYWIEDQLAGNSTRFYTSASWHWRVEPSATDRNSYYWATFLCLPMKSHQRLIDAKPFFVNWTPSELPHGSPLPIMKCKMNLERLPPLSRRRYRIVQHQFRKTLSKNWGTICHQPSFHEPP